MANETKWTKTPWEIRGDILYGADGTKIADLIWAHTIDQHLIAAAPDFAGAARDAKAAGWQHTPGCPTGECWCYRLGAALAKAEGRRS